MLTVVEYRVLEPLRFRAREERWNHKTLSALRARGLVSSERHQGGNSWLRWSITDAGRSAVESFRR